MSTSRAVAYLPLLLVAAVTTASAQAPGGAAAKPAAAHQAVDVAAKAKVATQIDATAKVATQVEAKALAKGALLGQVRRQSFERGRVLATNVGGVALPADLRAQCTNVMNQHPSDAAQTATPGFGTKAGQTGPFVEEKFADGVVIYRFSPGSAIAPPNAAPYYCRYMVAAMEVPRAAPPAIASDDSQQAKWARYHNSQLHAVIRRLVHYDDATMQQIDKAARAATQGDLFKTTDFLTGVADFYAGNVP